MIIMRMMMRRRMMMMKRRRRRKKMMIPLPGRCAVVMMVRIHQMGESRLGLDITLLQIFNQLLINPTPSQTFASFSLSFLRFVH